jgi:hypothetical protein
VALIFHSVRVGGPPSSTRGCARSTRRPMTVNVRLPYGARLVAIAADLVTRAIGPRAIVLE